MSKNKKFSEFHIIYQKIPKTPFYKWEGERQSILAFESCDMSWKRGWSWYNNLNISSWYDSIRDASIRDDLEALYILGSGITFLSCNWKRNKKYNSCSTLSAHIGPMQPSLYLMRTTLWTYKVNENLDFLKIWLFRKFGVVSTLYTVIDILTILITN